MRDLPLRQMVLYKHGVGFFVRQGAVTGEEVTLSFKADEINDVLKSLAIFDQSGGQVRGVHYRTPMDRATRLASSSVHLSDQSSLRDLIRDLRGRAATLNFETRLGETVAISGRIIGLDEKPQQHNSAPYTTALISVLLEDHQVGVFELDALTGLHIQDGQAAHDLSYFLDTSMAEDERRTVTVRLSEGEHNLMLHYVAPSPTWRVSYRIVAESEKGGGRGKALLQGWGLFDNRLDEDLEEVQVTLVAGQPISFIYELYASRIPQRPRVQDQARIAPGPIEYQEALPDADEAMVMGAMSDEFAESVGLRSRVMKAAPAAPARASFKMEREQMQAAAPAQAVGQEAGEFFQYQVTTPVSVKRGESALVPIISTEVSYERELLYNGAKLPQHPVAALRFLNSSGLTLERGPVTLVEDGDYKGEAVVAFAKSGREVYLPYAVELSIKITEEQKNSSKTEGLNIKGAYVVFEQYLIHETNYTIENSSSKPQQILIEAARETGWDLFDTPAPIAETATERRWRVTVQANSKMIFIRKDRRLNFFKEEIRNLDYQRLSEFLSQRWLDQATYQALQGLLQTVAQIEKLKQEGGKLQRERDERYKQQEQLRANLGALSGVGDEAALRGRILSQFEAAQNRLEAIERRGAELAQEINQAEARIEQIINSLGS